MALPAPTPRSVPRRWPSAAQTGASETLSLSWRLTDQDLRAATRWAPAPWVPVLLALAAIPGVLLSVGAKLPGWVAAALLGLLVASGLRWLWRERPPHQGLLGVPGATWRLDATSAGLTWRCDEGEGGSGWEEVQRIQVLRHHVLVQLQARDVVAVPRRAFGSEAAERETLALWRAWRRQPAPPQEPGLDGFDLHYALTPAELLGFGRSTRGRGLLRLVLGGLTGSGPPFGAVHLRLGPAGGWIGGSGSVRRFAWPDVDEVVVGDGVVTLIGRRGPVLVPFRALPDAAGFVRRCRAWRAAAARPRRAPSPTPPDPYAPPE